MLYPRIDFMCMVRLNSEKTTRQKMVYIDWYFNSSSPCRMIFLSELIKFPLHPSSSEMLVMMAATCVNSSAKEVKF